MIIAKQSTARTMMIGPVLDADGVAVTDCVVGDFEGSVNGGDPAALNGSATLTHRGVGFYSLALTATDLATVGQFEVTINDTTNACPMKEITVVEEAVYDAFFAASAVGYVANAPVNVAQIEGADPTDTIRDSVVDDATRIDASALNTASVTSIPAILVDTGTTLQAELDGIQADTEDIQTRLPAALTAGGNMKSDALAISGDTVAADNAESFFDGAGYAGTNNVIPSVTTVAAIGTGGITNLSIAVDAIGSSEFADSAVDKILDDTIGDSTVTVRQALRIFVAALGGIVSGAGTGTVAFRDAANSKDVITATVDLVGNRSAVTLNP